MTTRVVPADYFARIRLLTHLRDDDPPRSDMKLWDSAGSSLSCYYAPFDYLNKEARLILVGITPGCTQMNRALNAARTALVSSVPIAEAIRHVKRQGSFSGNMRPNIVNTLNRLGYQRKLGIACSSSLWSNDDHLVQFCSLLKFPVFFKGKDYNGNPKAHRDKDLMRMLDEHFVSDMNALPHDAIVVPLGDTVLEVVSFLKDRGSIPQDLMRFENQYVAPPHPSGANAESIALLLEPIYPTEIAYTDRMYRDYLRRQPWKAKGGKAQLEAKYKAVRASRWNSMLFVRRAYDLQ